MKQDSEDSSASSFAEVFGFMWDKVEAFYRKVFKISLVFLQPSTELTDGVK